MAKKTMGMCLVKLGSPRHVLDCDWLEERNRRRDERVHLNF